MITYKDCLAKYGDPRSEKFMVLWDVPEALEVGAIPKRLYCNRDLIDPLRGALENVITRGLADQIKTWDGCFNIRNQRKSTVPSLHSWGLAIDINAAWNKLGCVPTMPRALVKCFKDSGFDWGGDFQNPDGMHFQIGEIT